jgi:hypothetical protein
MTDVLIMLAIVAGTVTGLSILLARLIPDDYDQLKPVAARTQPPASRRRT